MAESFEVVEASQQDPWVTSGELQRIRREAPTDLALLDDLADIREPDLADLFEDVDELRA